MQICLSLVLSAALSFSAIAYAHARSIAFAETASGAEGLVAAVSGADELGHVDAVLDAEAAADLRRAIAAAGFEGEEGATVSFISGSAPFAEVHLVGIKSEGMKGTDWQDFGGRAAGLAAKSKAKAIAVIAPEGADAADAALGAMLGQYEFRKYKSDKSKPAGELVFVTPQADGVRRSFEREQKPLADSVAWTRDMQSEPANVLYPEEFVRRAREAFAGVPGVTMETLDEGRMRELGMGAILAVGRGSARPPRMFIVRYQGAPGAPIAFAGKGITFDSGGISLKPNDGMWKMKADMSGAAASVGAVLALAKSRAPVYVVAVAALAENMPDGAAARPGDVLRPMSGKTIEIRSTDAEGRLVLADAMWYVQDRYKPRLLIDIATLTGAVGRALGDEYAGLFARDDAVAARVHAAGEATGEAVWRLPLHKNHFDQIKSDIAEIKNSDAGDPGASTGAAFIASFVKDETPWAHLDIAGVDWRTEETPTAPKGASGFGVRLLHRLALDYSQD